MKILIAGAHLTPAIAVAEQLQKNPGVEIVYVGRKTTMEGDQSKSQESAILPKMGIKFIPITTGRLQRSFTIYTIPSLLKIPVGFIQALFIILSKRPDVILSFGGYVALPVVFAGWLMSIPILVHEQTLSLGLANNISAYLATKIAVSFNSPKLNKEKFILTGNPIRMEIIQAALNNRPQHFPKLPQVLIMGGSQGSHLINLAVEQTLNSLIKIAKIIHISGDNKFNDFERLTEKKSSLGKLAGRYEIYRWRYQGLGQILQQADLVVCRAGMNTLVELAYLGKPALVIPLPQPAEQTKNAEFFQTLGLTKILPQAKLNGKSLLEAIKFMLKDLDQIKVQAKKAQTVVVADAAQRLALETIILGHHE